MKNPFINKNYIKVKVFNIILTINIISIKYFEESNKTKITRK